MFPSGVLTPGGGSPWIKVTKTFTDFQSSGSVVVATVGASFNIIESFFIITAAFVAPDITTGGLVLGGVSGSYVNSNVLAVSNASGANVSVAPRDLSAPADITGNLDIEDSNSDPIDPALLTAGSVDFYYRLSAVTT